MEPVVRNTFEILGKSKKLTSGIKKLSENPMAVVSDIAEKLRHMPAFSSPAGSSGEILDDLAQRFEDFSRAIMKTDESIMIESILLYQWGKFFETEEKN